MKAALYSCVFVCWVGLVGCQSSDSVYRRDDSRTVRFDLTRPARIYENGDGLFAMVNNTSRVQWFTGQDVTRPLYRVKTAGGGATDRNMPDPDKRTGAPERFPLSPGETRYFEGDIGNATGPIIVGITFYPSLTSTNGIMAWSSPTSVPAKPRTL